MFRTQRGKRSGRLSARSWAVVTLLSTSLLFLALVRYDTWQHKKAREAVPGLARGLQINKSRAEGHLARITRLGPDAAALAEGEKLYIAAKSRQDACITFLKTAVKQLTPQAAAEGQALLDAATESTQTFLDWAGKLEPAESYTKAIDPPSPLEIAAWIENQDDEEVRSLQDILEGCRFRDWGTMTARPPVGDRPD